MKVSTQKSPRELSIKSIRVSKTLSGLHPSVTTTSPHVVAASDSIARAGDTPTILVIHHKGKYILVGEYETFLAYKRLGRETVPAAVYTLPPGDSVQTTVLFHALGKQPPLYAQITAFGRLAEDLAPAAKLRQSQAGGDRRSDAARGRNPRSAARKHRATEHGEVAVILANRTRYGVSVVKLYIALYKEMIRQKPTAPWESQLGEDCRKPGAKPGPLARKYVTASPRRVLPPYSAPPHLPRHDRPTSLDRVAVA